MQKIFAMSLLLSFCINAHAGLNLFTDGNDVVELKCAELDQKGECQKFKFQETSVDGEVLKETEAMTQRRAQKLLDETVLSYKLVPSAGALIVGTGATVLFCAVSAASNGSKAPCLFIPVGIALDVVKAPLVLTYMSVQGPFRGVKRAVLAKRLKAALEKGEQKKVTKFNERNYNRLTTALFKGQTNE